MHRTVESRSTKTSIDVYFEQQRQEGAALRHLSPATSLKTKLLYETTMDPEGYKEALLGDETDVPDEKKAYKAPPVLICTAVPYGNVNTSETSSIASSISSDEEEDEEDVDYFRYFQLYSCIMGLIVGGFIQLSSLGANYMLTELYERRTYEDIIKFSLAWSLLTSVMGVTILLLIRSLVATVIKSGVKDVPTSVVLHLECYFAVGTLTGVCLAWTCTDIALGFRAHIWHSLGTLIIALLWCKALSYFFGPTAVAAGSSDESVASMLSLKPKGETTSSLHNEFKATSMVLGLVVGFFIQFSSLGANFVLTHLITQGMQLTLKHILLFSLAWSVMTSTMGILILTLARSLVWISSNNEDFIWYMEAFFATGALLGVNVAWMITDITLGLRIHYLHALVTEVVALVALLGCIHGSRKRTQMASSGCQTDLEEPLLP